MSNVTPMTPRTRPMSELEVLQVQVRVLTAYLDEVVHDWRTDIRDRMDEALS